MSQDRDRPEGEQQTSPERVDQDNAAATEGPSGEESFEVPADMPPPPPPFNVEGEGPAADFPLTGKATYPDPPPPPAGTSQRQNETPSEPPPPPSPAASAPPLSEEEEAELEAAAAEQTAPPASAPPDDEMPADAPNLRVRPNQEAFNRLPILVATSGSGEAFNGDLVGFISRYANDHGYNYIPPANERAGYQISIDSENSMTIHGDQNEFWIEPTGPNAVNESINFLQECTRAEPDFKVTLSGGSLQERWDIVQKVLDVDSPKLEFEAGFNIEQFKDMPGFSDIAQVFRDRQAPAPSAPTPPGQQTNQ